MNVWVARFDQLDSPMAITNDRTTGISEYFWAYDNDHILYLQDVNGNEDDHLYAVHREGGEARDLTPLDGIKAQLIAVSPDFPQEVLVGINDRDQHYFHDVYRVNIRSGETQLLVQNDGFAGFVADHRYNVRLALAITPNSTMEIYRADDSAEQGWTPLMTIESEDLLTTGPAGFDDSGQVLFMLDSRGRDTTAFKTLDLVTGDLKVVFASDHADVSEMLRHPTRHTVQAVGYNYDRPNWHILDESIRGDFEFLAQLDRGDFSVSSRTLDDQTWIVFYDADNAPIKYYRYDRGDKTATFLFSNRPELSALPLATMQPVVIRSRDGLELVSYLSLPNGAGQAGTSRPGQPLPMVLLVHGGPWAHDEWGFDPLHQLLANRGYAVLSVNYRGSTGFGKRFINAANREWAEKMHDDLVDAVRWAVEQGIAIREKIAIMGGSYGGYAALVGLTFTPELFACGVDLVGPSSLISLMENPPPYWMPLMPLMKERMGDWTTDEGRKFLQSRSPLFRVEQIKRPLLIGQGAQDPRVKQAESDQIVDAMKAKQIPVTYMLYPEEGHGFDRPENNLSFFAVTEHFLAKHLGGQTESVGNAFAGSNVQVPAGAEQIPGLSEALQK